MSNLEIIERIVLPISLALFAVAGGLLGNVLSHWLDKRKEERSTTKFQLQD